MQSSAYTPGIAIIVFIMPLLYLQFMLKHYLRLIDLMSNGNCMSFILVLMK